MNLRQAQKAQTRDAVVRKAASLLRHRGIPGVSVEKAMAGAGLTVGAFYAHFNAKDALVSEAFERALAELEHVLSKAATGSTGKEAIHKVIGLYLSDGHREESSQGCPLPAVVCSAALSQERLEQRHVERGVRVLKERIGATGGNALADDELLALVVVLVGGQILSRASAKTPLASKILSASRLAAERILAKEAT